MGRYKDMLKIGGENVDPMEVEAYLMRHPAINLAAVVSYPDPRLSEVGVAFVRCEPGQTLAEADVLEYCRGRIASFKIPRHVFLVDEFPMTSSGKIQKVKLREEALRRLWSRRADDWANDTRVAGTRVVGSCRTWPGVGVASGRAGSRAPRDGAPATDDRSRSDARLHQDGRGERRFVKDLRRKIVAPAATPRW